MSKSQARPIFWIGAFILIAGLIVGYRVVVAAFAAQEAASRVDENLVHERSTEPATASPARQVVPDRASILPENVGEGWPGILGPAGDCSSPERGLDWSWPDDGPPLRWRATAGLGYSSPVVLGEKLILFHRVEDQERLDCLDAETGRPQWSFAAPADYQCPVNYTSGPYSTPVVEPGSVYAIGPGGATYCLDLQDGTPRWQRKLHEDYEVVTEMWPATASPILEGGRLILNLGGKPAAGIVALDRKTGETLWSVTDDGPSCSTPVAATIHGTRYLFVWTADALVSLDPIDGTVFWRIPFAANNGEAAHGTSPLVIGDAVIVSGYQIGNLCVRVLPDGSPKVLWRDRRELLDSQYNNILSIDGNVCGFAATRVGMRCLDLQSGELIWQFRPRIPNGTTISVDDRYLLWGVKGRLAALKIDGTGVEILAKTRVPLLTGPCYSYPALHNGLLYVRNEEELLCFDLRRAAANTNPKRKRGD